MNETVTGFTCRKGSEACYFCGGLKGELHEYNCPWITDLKIRNIVNEAEIARKAALEAKEDLRNVREDYRSYLAKAECNRSYLSKKNNEMKKQLKILEAFLDTLVR